MGQIIALPTPAKSKPSPVRTATPVPTRSVPTDTAKPGTLSRVLSVVWILFLLTWPLVEKIVAFDIVYQFLRALYYWNVPGTYAGLTFLVHLMAASALTYLVATRPIK